MVRATKGPARRRAHKKILKQAKGYWGARSRLYRQAKQAVTRALATAYRDRRQRRRQFRRLWITRISAACRQRDLRYSQFIAGLRRAGVALDRKQLSEMAIASPETFDQLVTLAREHLAPEG